MNGTAKLVYMANQIARNFATMGADRAAAATADHLASFWDPRMKALILDAVKTGDAGLEPIAADAVRLLRDHGPPPPQTRATEFNAADESGHADAG